MTTITTPRPQLTAAPGPLAIRSIPAHPTNYSNVRRIPTLIVLHATDGAEGKTSAENNAVEITRPNRDKSWHYLVDADTVVQQVPDALRAWHCGRSGNAPSIGVELCGDADQTEAQWYDAASLATMQLAARLVADLCLRWSIPPVFVPAAGLVKGQPGITTHAEVRDAWRQTVHYDPGPGFPLRVFVDAVARATVVLGPPAV